MIDQLDYLANHYWVVHFILHKNMASIFTYIYNINPKKQRLHATPLSWSSFILREYLKLLAFLNSYMVQLTNKYLKQLTNFCWLVTVTLQVGVVGDTMYFSISPSLLDAFVTDSFLWSCPRTFSVVFYADSMKWWRNARKKTSNRHIIFTTNLSNDTDLKDWLPAIV